MLDRDILLADFGVDGTLHVLNVTGEEREIERKKLRVGFLTLYEAKCILVLRYPLQPMFLNVLVEVQSQRQFFLEVP